MHGDSHFDKSITGRFKYAIILTSATLIAEIVGGLWTNSLALLSDAAHVFLDLFALLLSLGAIKLASMPVSDTRTFGWHRTEVFASFINGSTIFIIGVIICYEAFGRVMAPEPVKSLPMLVIAGIGLATNLIAAGALHSHSHDDLNVRSAFLHLVGDAAASVGVIAGGVIMYFTGWFMLDALISVAIGLLIFWGSWRVMRESVHILLEGVPRGVEVREVEAAMREVDGVGDVHHVNIWTICSHIIALSGHIVLHPSHCKEEYGPMLRKIEESLFERFHISHTTLQVETTRCTAVEGAKQFRHRPRAASLSHVHSHGHHAHGSCSHHHH